MLFYDTDASQLQSKRYRATQEHDTSLKFFISVVIGMYALTILINHSDVTDVQIISINLSGWSHSLISGHSYSMFCSIIIPTDRMKESICHVFCRVYATYCLVAWTTNK